MLSRECRSLKCAFDTQLNSLLAIDKLTEKSQVSEDGTMVALPQIESPQIPEPSSAAGASDTESISGRDTEVREYSVYV